MFTRIKSYSRLKKNKEKINCNNEDEEIKKISKDINREYKRAIYLDFSSPKKHVHSFEIKVLYHPQNLKQLIKVRFFPQKNKKILYLLN